MLRPDRSFSLIFIESLGPASIGQRQGLARYELELTELTFERCYLIRPNGNVYSKDGEEDSITFSEDEVTVFKDGILTHSHPRGYPISDRDIYTAVVHNTAEVRAVRCGRSRTDAIVRPPGGWPPRIQVRDALIRADDALEKLLLARRYSSKSPLSYVEIEEKRWKFVRRFLPRGMALENV